MQFLSAVVGLMPRAWRSNNLALRARSTAAICTLMLGWVEFIRAAGLEKVPSSKTARKYSSCLRSTICEELKGSHIACTGDHH